MQQMEPRDMEDLVGYRSLHGHVAFGSTVKVLEEKYRPGYGWGPVTKMSHIGWVRKLSLIMASIGK